MEMHMGLSLMTIEERECMYPCKEVRRALEEYMT
jgi:hypothetical protein